MTVNLFVNGEEMKPSSGKYSERFDPGNNDRLIGIIADGSEDVGATVDAARNAFDSNVGGWVTDYRLRARVLLKAAELIREKLQKPTYVYLSRLLVKALRLVEPASKDSELSENNASESESQEKRTPTSERHCIKGLSQSLPNSGTYVLVILLKRSVWVCVGALGMLFFKKGVYVYVGSARRGLRPRIGRHLAKGKRLRWHIDWITSRRFFEVREIWITGAVGVECDLAAALNKQADGVVPRFGSSDCGCRSHLLYFCSGGMGDLFHRLGLLRVI